jgi:hypothetical protein
MMMKAAMHTKTQSWRRRWLAGLLGLAMAGAAGALPLSEQEKTAVGTWYGEFSSGADKPLQRFLSTRQPDGTYVLQARLYEKGKPTTELRNKGLWGISNGLYFTVTTEVNGLRTDFKSPEVSNPYLVRALGPEVFEYQHIPSGNLLRAIRVDPEKARLPD